MIDDASKTPVATGWLATWLPAHRSFSLFLCFVLTAMSVHHLYDFRHQELRLQIDPSVNALLSQDDESMAFYKSVLEDFGSENVAVVGLMDPEPFSLKNQKQLTELTDAIEQLDGVDHVRSLSNAVDPQPIGDDLTVGDFLEEREGLDTSPAALHARAINHPLYANSLVAGNGKGTALLVHFGDLSDQDFLASELDQKIRAVANEHWSGESLLVSGMPVVKAETSRLLLLNIARNIPAVFLVGALVFMIVFRSARAAVAPLLTIGAASLWTLGAMAAGGHRLNIVTSIVPVLVTTLGFATVMYVQSEYRASLTEGHEGKKALEQTLYSVLLPIAMTCLTTIAGFLALLVSPLNAIQDFAIYSAIGVASTAFSSVVLGSALLSLGLSPKARPDPEPPPIFHWWAGMVFEKQKAIFVGAAVCLALTIFGTLKVRVDFDVIENLSGSGEVLRDTRQLNKHFGGATPFYVVLESTEENAFEKPTNLEAMKRVQNWLEAQPEVGDTNSFSNLIETLYVAFRGEGASSRLPPTEAIVSQLLLLIDPATTESLVNESRTRASIVVRAKQARTAVLSDLVDRLQVELDKMPKGIDARVTGDTILLSHAVNDIAKGQAQSLTLAFIAIFWILAGYLRSLREAILVLIPNVLPVLFFFGLLGLTDTPLDQSTALLACIILGVAVDDTIHCIVRYRREIEIQPGPAEAITSTLRALAPPVTSTTILLVGGLSVLAFSEMRNLAMFGKLGATTLAFAWVVDLTLTPALCLLLKAKTTKLATDSPAGEPSPDTQISGA
ncbi:MAG: MMPL family transporter [Polyangiaceae bacterium]|nr:MMPL family transporter [Polyangiaceae bacterium]